MDRSELLTLVFTDLVGSTALKRERGDQVAGALIARHRDLVSSLTAGTGARIIDWAGDGCFLTFDAPSAAVSFALALQDAHACDTELPHVRIGIHLGEVTVVGTRVEGLAVDLAARVSSLASPGQVLLSGPAFDSARQRLRSDAAGQPIAWRAHGPYLLKGNDKAVEICEAGREGMSPLSAPPDSEKARRSATEAQEETLGWRPAVGLHIPSRANWVLDQPLGEGGFGEVWLAAHEKTHARRVFKFCFEPERISGLRREVVLFRLLRETLGARPDIAQIVDWQFDSAPYFIESEYTEGGDLRAWAEAQGGLAAVPLETRLELIAQAADALAAAHSVGVLHKDIKPGNILVTRTPAGTPQACLTDFGIGLILDRGALLGKNITAAGLTDSLVSSSTPSSNTGTRMYMAPELIEGKPASTLSDIYALGVVMYQVVSGDLSRSLAAGWERDVNDDFLREDVAACIDGDPARRLPSAAELAKRLRSLAERRAAREKERHLVLESAKAKRRRRQFIVVTAIGMLTTIVIGIAGLRETDLRKDAELAKIEAMQLRDEAMTAKTESDHLRRAAEYDAYISNVNLAAAALNRSNAAQTRAILQRAAPEYRGWEWGHLALEAWPLTNSTAAPTAPVERISTAERWRGTTARLFRAFNPHKNPMTSVDFSPDGTLLATLGQDGATCVTRIDNVELLWRKPASYAGGGTVRFSPNGRWLAHPDNRDWAVSDALSGEEISRTKGHTEPGSTHGFSADSTSFITTSLDGTIRSWETRTGRERWRLDRVTRLHDATGTKYSGFLGFSADRSRFIIADGNNGFLYVDVNTGEIGHPLPLRLPPGWVPQDLGPKSESVIAHSRAELLWGEFDVNSGKQREGVGLYTMRGPWATTSVLSLDGSISFVRSELGSIGRIDLESGGVVKDGSSNLIEGLTNFGGMDALALSPDGASLAVPQADGSVYIYTPADKNQYGSSEMKHAAPVFTAHFDPVHRQIVSADLSGGLIAWDTDRRTMIHKWKGHSDGITELEASPDFSRWLTHSYDGTYALWSLEAEEPIAVFENKIPKLLAGGANGPLVRLAASLLSRSHFSPDGTRIALAKGTTEAHVLDAATLKPLFNLPGLKAYAIQCYFSPKGTLIITHGYQEPFVKVWDAKTGEPRFTLSSDKQIIGTAVAPDDSTLVATTLTPKILRWELNDGRALPDAKANDTASLPVFFSPDGAHFVTGGIGGTVSLRNAKDGSLITELTGHNQNALTARFNPAGDRILSLGMDKTIRVWDLRGNEVALFEFADDLYYAEWSQDGNQFLVTSRDGSVRILDSAPWAELEKSGEPEASIEDRLTAWRERGTGRVRP